MKLTTKGIAASPMPAVLMLAVTALAVTACGGGGSGGGSTPPPQNASPRVSALTSQTVNQDTPTSALAFTLSDDGGPDALMLSVISSNTAIVPVDGISLSGSGANRALRAVPAEDATGSLNITVQATDAQGLIGVSSFTLTVKAVEQSIASYTNSTFAQGENDTPAQVSGFTFVQDADDDATFDPLLQ
jgi:hypothetical protein